MSKTLKATSGALAIASLMAASWMAGSITTLSAAEFKLSAQPLVCAQGFASNGNTKGYTCTSQLFKCNAGLHVLNPHIVGDNRAIYTCGKIAGMKPGSKLKSRQ